MEQRFFIPWKIDAPSTHADSSKSKGIESIKFFIIQIPYGKEDAVKKVSSQLKNLEISNKEIIEIQVR